jgi:iron-sulfur cluster assembly protein
MVITDRALTKLKSLQQGDQGLRVQVVGGGCSGLSYKMSWIVESNEGDKMTAVDGLHIVVDPKSYLFLNGVELDYTDGLDGQGFVWSNPNAKRTCGCGTSFSV